MGSRAGKASEPDHDSPLPLGNRTLSWLPLCNEESLDITKPCLAHEVQKQPLSIVERLGLIVVPQSCRRKVGPTHFNLRSRLLRFNYSRYKETLIECGQPSESCHQLIQGRDIRIMFYDEPSIFCTAFHINSADAIHTRKCGFNLLYALWTVISALRDYRIAVDVKRCSDNHGFNSTTLRFNTKRRRGYKPLPPLLG